MGMTIEQELATLKTRVAHVETMLRQLLEADGIEVEEPVSGEHMNQEELLTWLKAHKLIIEAPPETHVYVERWQARSTEEQQAILRELDQLPDGPMVSDIVIENRR